MFNVGGPEVMVILIVALVVLGPQQLPKAMRTFGSVMSEVRKVSNGFQAEMRAALDAADETPSEKPQSGSMATHTPADPHVREVAARNPSPSSPSDEPSGHDEGDEQVAPVDASDRGVDAHASTDGPVIDPVDRAAG